MSKITEVGIIHTHTRAPARRAIQANECYGSEKSVDEYNKIITNNESTLVDTSEGEKGQKNHTKHDTIQHTVIAHTHMHKCSLHSHSM